MIRLTRRRVAVGGALLGVAFAASYGYAPGLVPAAIRTPVASVSEAIDPRLVLVSVGAITGVIGLLYAWVIRPDDGASAIGRETETPERSAAVAGCDLTAAYDQLVARGELDDGGELAKRLHDVVIEAHRQTAGGESVVEYVDRGAWTDDRYAAAFLSMTAEVDYPWYHRLYAWLYPGRAYEYRVDRALRAAEIACAEQLSGYDAPTAKQKGRVRSLLTALEESS